MIPESFDLPRLLRSRRGVLFDFNGTLSDDERQLEQAYGLGLLDLGLPGLSETEYQSLLGMSDPDISARLLAARGAGADTDKLLDAVAARYLEIYRRTPLISDRTVDMLAHLETEGTRTGIVTGTLRRMIEPVLRERGLAELIDWTVTIEDVAAGKPSPEGFLAGAALLGLPPAQIIAVEDSAAGAEAARAAGMTVIGVTGADQPGCDLTFDSMDDLAAAVLAQAATPR